AGARHGLHDRARRIPARIRRRSHRRRRAGHRDRLRTADQSAAREPDRAITPRLMDFEEIRQILEMMREHDIAEFELERDNVKLRLRKNAAGHWSATPAVPQGQHLAPTPPAPPPAGAP